MTRKKESNQKEKIFKYIKQISTPKKNTLSTVASKDFPNPETALYFLAI